MYCVYHKDQFLFYVPGVTSLGTDIPLLVFVKDPSGLPCLFWECKPFVGRYVTVPDTPSVINLESEVVFFCN